jgi:hypothetical protein
MGTRRRLLLLGAAAPALLAGCGFSCGTHPSCIVPHDPLSGFRRARRSPRSCAATIDREPVHEGW